MIAYIRDNFLSEKECKYLINFYKQNKNKSFSFRDVYPLTLLLSQTDLKFLFDKMNIQSKKINNSLIHWCEIVRWPEDATQNLHLDDSSEETTLSSIIYLNDSFKGGETCFEDGTIFKPVAGRSLFFDGTYFKHGVKPVKQGSRFVVATWYRNPHLKRGKILD